ncbi:hypothetical protein [Kitasatospora sp. NPDC091207]|uniref:hypothetical protein n=1 Tax=Kitasatospora sp. NPDC091207 TaxID=3364083 RepID=UPI003815BFB3
MLRAGRAEHAERQRVAELQAGLGRLPADGEPFPAAPDAPTAPAPAPADGRRPYPLRDAHLTDVGGEQDRTDDPALGRTLGRRRPPRSRAAQAADTRRPTPDVTA